MRCIIVRTVSHTGLFSLLAIYFQMMDGIGSITADVSESFKIEPKYK
jgi:hypothetical protein